MKTRAQMIAEWKRQRFEIKQLLIDVEHWNSTHPNEEPINVDEDRKLSKIASRLDDLLKKESAE